MSNVVLSTMEDSYSVRQCNAVLAEQLISEYASARNGKMLKRQLSQCGLEDVREELLDRYVENILAAYSTRSDTEESKRKCKGENAALRLDEIRKIIYECNKIAAIARINSCLHHDDAEATLVALRYPDARLPSVCMDDAALFFHEEMREVKSELQKDLVHGDLVGALTLLNAMVDVCVATRSGKVRDLWNALSSPKTYIQELDEKQCSAYLQELKGACGDRYISLPVVQECVDNVNMRATRPSCLKRLDEALTNRYIDEALEAMRSIQDLRQHYNDKWRHLQVELLLQYREVNYQDSQLQLDEICDIMNISSRVISEAERLGEHLKQLSKDVREGNVLLVASQLEYLRIPGLDINRVDDYARTLVSLAHRKAGQAGWPTLARGFLTCMDRTIDIIFSLDSEEIFIGPIVSDKDERSLVDMRDIEYIVQTDRIQQAMGSRQPDKDGLQQQITSVQQEVTQRDGVQLRIENARVEVDHAQQEMSCQQQQLDNDQIETDYSQQEMNTIVQEHEVHGSHQQIDRVEHQTNGTHQQQTLHLQLEDVAAIKIQTFVRRWIGKKRYKRHLHFQRNLRHVCLIQRWWRNAMHARKTKANTLEMMSSQQESNENQIMESSSKGDVDKVQFPGIPEELEIPAVEGLMDCTLENTATEDLAMPFAESVKNCTLDSISVEYVPTPNNDGLKNSTLESTVTEDLEIPNVKGVINCAAIPNTKDSEIYVLESKNFSLEDTQKSTVRRLTSKVKIIENSAVESALDEDLDFHVSEESEIGRFGTPAMDYFKNSEMKDLFEELKCRILKESVARLIKKKQSLEKQIAVTDTQIGLLVKNRISLEHAREDAENIDPETPKASTPKKKLEKVFYHRDRTPTIGRVHCSELDTYEKLFYKLQTNPKYLYKLISLISPNSLERFDEQRIFAIFQFGSEVREQYLLLNFFQTALECEVRDRVNTVGDITSGKHLPILQMIIQFYRNYMTGPGLEMLMQSLVCRVMDDPNMIDTNPVNVYKKVVGNVDAGVSSDSALQNKEVWKKIKESISSLKHHARTFLAAFNDNVDCLPYGYRFTLRTLKQALEKKFPKARTSDIFKVIGHILYDKALSPIIKRPCCYLNLGVSSLFSFQQFNLNQIDCILQYAVAKKGFGSECAHLQCLNSFIISCHEKFKTYLERVCDVGELEGHFHWDHLSEATLMYKPELGIMVEDVMSLHVLLKQYEEKIADSEYDPLLAVLEKLGPTPPSAQILLSEAGGIIPRKVHLALNPQVDVSEKQSRLLVAKQYLNDLLLVYPDLNLGQILNSPTSQEHEAAYVGLLLKCEKLEPPTDNVEKLKENVKVYLRETGTSTSQLVRQLTGELIRHRDQRRLEMHKLKTTLNKLQQNVKFCEAKVEEYNHYLEMCLQNQNLKQKKKHKKGGCKPKPLKYNGTELKHRGILESLGNLREKDLQHIIFHISAGEKPGSFLVQCTMLGAEMDIAELRLQELLELQYHGEKTVQLFGQVNVSVNELVHLLNRKFLCSSK